jgi:oligoendopeptidase F
MTRKTTYSQNYHVYYVYGSVFSHTLSANTLRELKLLRERGIKTILKDNTEDNLVEAIRFDDIRKTVTHEIFAAQDIKVAKKITNRYW